MIVRLRGEIIDTQKGRLQGGAGIMVLVNCLCLFIDTYSESIVMQFIVCMVTKQHLSQRFSLRTLDTYLYALRKVYIVIHFDG